MTRDHPWATRSRRALGAVAAVLLVAAVGVGCSSDGTGGAPSSTPPATTTTTKAPAATGAPDPATAPAPTWQLGTGDLLSSFRDTPYNDEGAPPPVVVNSPNIPGRQAVSYTVPGGGIRAELEPKIPSLNEGDEAWYGFAWYLPPDFPVNTPDWQVVAQWKNFGDGSPPIEVKVGNGQFVLDGGAGGHHPAQNYFTQPIGAAQPGQQTDIVVHITFSSDPGQATADVWENGQQKITNFHPANGTLYEGEQSYLKTGIYRDSAIAQSATLFLDDARVGSSYESAAALAGAGAPSK
ncbi:polysaccharide lyase [Actinomycetospora endophytica]|uniref:Polysaccharide lyase n=1 Tax=Actinomycetospora endophytica TaxID=2291215 RepID=A0ABS8P1H9_9PSEU|nr:heparin lyase I family protein [Actinomycetospora endophytica]MCD2192089.1 polysaccharide lyase [Actinomycetospora endophytica]